MKKWFTILVVTLIAIPLLLQIDDDVSIEVKALIENINQAEHSDAYLYFIGISTPATEDPMVIGAKNVEAAKQLAFQDTDNQHAYDDEPKLALPNGDVFCKLWQEHCIATLFSADADYASLMSKHKVLVARITKLNSLDDYKTLLKPTLNEPLPPYQYLVAGHRIKVLSAISLYQQDKKTLAVTALLEQFQVLRQMLARQDQLIGKVAYLTLMAEVMDVTSVILSDIQTTNMTEIASIPRLSLEEKSFKLAAAREFAMGYYTFKSLDKHPEFFQQGARMPSWLVRLAFKPNMTSNLIAPLYTQLVYFSELSAADLAKELTTESEADIAAFNIRNILGQTLANIAQPDLNKYVALFADFDVKIALFNHRYTNNTGLINPYYSDDKPIYKQGRICLNGPLEDEKLIRCLIVSLEEAISKL